MTSQPHSRWRSTLLTTLALVASVVCGGGSVARAGTFPSLPNRWLLVGAYQDSSNIPHLDVRCVGSFGPRPDSLRRQARTLSLRFLRDRRAEVRPDFGGYRIYRMVGTSFA